MTVSFRRLLASLALVLITAAPLSATSVLQLSPKEVDARAERIFVGACISVKPVLIEEGREAAGMPVTDYVFRVEEAIKGEGVALGDTLVLRQHGHPKAAGPSFRIPGLPEYLEGHRYRLSLHGTSRIGLSSPVGLGQGVRHLGVVAAEVQP